MPCQLRLRMGRRRPSISTNSKVNKVKDKVKDKSSIEKAENEDSLTDSHVADAILIDSDEEKDIPDTQPVDHRVLKDVVAFVEVRAKAENRSKGVSKQLQLLGAEVSLRLSNDVTHVVWKEGKRSTLDKAAKKGILVVSVLWVDSCKQNQEHVAESLFPVADPGQKDVLQIGRLKRMKSMQPKTLEEDLQRSQDRVSRKKRRRGQPAASPAPLVLTPLALAPLALPPSILVAETQPMTPISSAPPTPSLIPDTPSHMKKCLDLLDSISRNKGSAQRRLSSTDSPNLSSSTPLQQRLLQCFTEEVTTLTDTPTSSVRLHKSGPTKRLASKRKLETEWSKVTSSSKEEGTSGTGTERRTSETPKSHKRPLGNTVAPGSSDSPRSHNQPFGNTVTPRIGCPLVEEEIPENHRRTRKDSKTSSRHENSSVFEEEVPENHRRTRKDSKTSSRHENSSVFEEEALDKDEMNCLSIKTEMMKSSRQSCKSLESETSVERYHTERIDPIDFICHENAKRKKRVSLLLDDSKEVCPASKPSVSQTRRRSCRGLENSKSKSSTICDVKASSDGKTDKQLDGTSKDIVQAHRRRSCRGLENSLGKSSIIYEVDTYSDGKTDQQLDATSKGIVPAQRRRSCRGLENFPNKTDNPGNVASRGDAAEHSVMMNKSEPEDPATSKSKAPKRRKLLSSNSKIECIENMDESRSQGIKSGQEGSASAGAGILKERLKQQIMPTKQRGRPGRSRGTETDTGVLDNHVQNVAEENETSSAVDPSDIMVCSTRTSQLRFQGRPSLEEFKTQAPHSKQEKASKTKKVTKTESLPLNKKKKSTLVMTSLHRSDQEVVMSVAMELGRFTITDTVCETTTHVVIGENRRTLNVLSGIARGCWLLSMDWVYRSVEAGVWLPEEPYEMNDHFPGAMISRLAHSETVESSSLTDIFASAGALYVPADASPPRERLMELLELCGGRVSPRASQAVLRVGGSKQGKRGAKPIVAETWILDCITGFKVLPWERYVLK